MLTVRDHMTLALAAAPYRYPAARASHALERIGYTETAFWARVLWLIDQPEAEIAYPAFARRQRRLREMRRIQRVTGCERP